MKGPRERDKQWVMVDGLDYRGGTGVPREGDISEFTGGRGGVDVVDGEYGELSGRKEGCEMKMASW